MAPERPTDGEQRGRRPADEGGEEAAPKGATAAAIVRWVLLAAMIVAALVAFYTCAASRSGQIPPPSEPAPQPVNNGAPGRLTAPYAPNPVDAGMPPPGTTPITLAFDRVQAIGVRTAAVERREIAGGLRVSAVVEAPDQGRAEIHARAAGFVEALRVREVGVKVKAGELLASIYSPEIFRAQQELLAIASWRGPDRDAAPEALAPMMAAARKRLELLGVGSAAIDRIARGGEPLRAIGVSSPITGYVVRKSIVLGSSVSPDMTLFEIVDLDRVYVIGSVYPSDLADIQVGRRATFTTPALPGRAFEAKVDLLYPEVDLVTRTARVRFQVRNDDLALRPGQYGIAEIHGPTVVALTVPLDAVVDTGLSTYVFAVEEGGRYVPRAVELGEEIGERVVVRQGVHEGERVVSGATFLIDAESRLQASIIGGP